MRGRTVATYALITLTCSAGAVAAAVTLAVHSASGDTPSGTETACVFALLAFLCAGVTWTILYLADRPVAQLRQSMRTALRGDYQHRAGDRLDNSSSELARLAKDFDDMTTRAQCQLMSRARMLRNLSDELRSPLSRLQAIVSILHQGRGEDDALVARMQRELSELHALIADVLTYSQLEHRNHLKRQRTNLSDLVRTIAEDAAAAGAADNISVSLACREQFYADVEHALLYTALENLVRHGMSRLAAGETLALALSGDSDRVTLDILHTDRPITQAASLDHLFEPFYPAPGAGGICLAVARRAITMHGGGVEAVNTSQGLRLRLWVPVLD